MDFQKLTLKSQEAVAAAQELARRMGNPELYPEHLLLALLDQELPQRLVPDAAQLRAEAEARLRAKPSIVGAQQQPGASAALSRVLDKADDEARRMEGDARQIRRMALEAFNRSPHVDRVVAISRSLGDPVVNVAVEGCELPRVVSIVVAWDISWYEYEVRLDLYEQTVAVDEGRRGDDPRDLPVQRLHPNAVLRSDRVVLTMQAFGVGQGVASRGGA